MRRASRRETLFGECAQCEKKRREVLVQLGGTFSSLRSRKGGRLLLRVAFGQNCTEDVECHCYVRLTWDVFVRDLNRQLGTPSHWLPVDSCKEGQKGALAAVCTPTIKSASKKHQKLCTSVSEHRVWHSEGGKRKLCLVYIFSFWPKSFPSSLCVTSRLEQATRVFLEN